MSVAVAVSAAACPFVIWIVRGWVENAWFGTLCTSQMPLLRALILTARSHSLPVLFALLANMKLGSWPAWAPKMTNSLTGGTVIRNPELQQSGFALQILVSELMAVTPCHRIITCQMSCVTALGNWQQIVLFQTTSVVDRRRNP